MRLVWTHPEGRVLAVQPVDMALHVGKVPAPAPAIGADLAPEAAAALRPIDWASVNRIVGPDGLPGFVEQLVKACWEDVSRVALIYANNPDKWPARHTFRDHAAERGTVRSLHERSSPMTPLERLGLGESQTHEIQNQIKSGGAFPSLEDLAKRVPRVSLDYVRRQIIDQIRFELGSPGTGAMFFARTAAGTKFHGTAPAAAATDEDDDDDRPGLGMPRRYR